MKIEKIKPIPKYMIDKIRKLDLIKYSIQDGHTRYYAYLTKNDGELVKVTVAVRNRYKKWYCKQVAIHGVHTPNKCFVKDMRFYYIAGYIVEWYKEDFCVPAKEYTVKDWGWFDDDKYFDPFALVINQEYAAEKFPEYRYSGVDKTNYVNVIKYLRYYEKYPQIEYLTKLGLEDFVFSKIILNRLQKDKAFMKWLIKNRENICHKDYYVKAIIEAYKKNKPVSEVDAVIRAKKRLQSDTRKRPILELFKSDLDRFLSYIGKQNTSVDNYADYLNACLELGVDMTEDKNRYPHDFKHWHDIRIDEYNSKKAILDEQKRKAFYEQFYSVAMKYIGLEYNKKAAYIAIIAQKPSDLITEGDILCHCVGRMNYDQRFVREDSLIFFIRAKENPNTPFVTLEYSPSQKKILQCYGYKDSRPSVEVLDFVNKKWLPYANKQISKMAA